MFLIRLFTRRKKMIDLVLPRYYPEGHKRSGEATHFASKLLSSTSGKIHTLCFDEPKWNMLDKRAYLRIVYCTLRNRQLSTTIITTCKYMGIQSVVIPYPDDTVILVDNREISLELFCRNEGLKDADFCDWYKNDGGKQAVVVHFSDFRY